MLTIGKIVKPQGLQGEVKIVTQESDTKRYAKLSYLFLNGKQTKVLSFRAHDGFFIAKLEGISDRTSAENFRNYIVSAPKEELTLNADEFYFEDLIGCTIIDGQKNKIGTLIEIEQFGGADVFTARGVNNILFSFPFIQKIVIDIDISAKTVMVDKEELDKNKVYP